MAEENIFFIPVKEICRRNVVTCSPDDRLVDVAAVMRKRSISSVVVCEGGEPIGIFTDRDLRNKVVAQGADPGALSVASVMNAPLIVIREEDFLFEALYRMIRHNIHRVGVVDSSGRLTGIVTDSDILKIQTRSPQQMVRDIDLAETLDELRDLHRRIQELVGHLVRTGVRTQDLVRLISHLNDKIHLRLIALLREGKFADLPDRFAFVVLGSEGRREQTLTTDQDNALVYADDLTDAQVKRLEAFSRELVDSLISIGVPPCPGGIMAKNEAWRRSLGQWIDVLDDWLSAPTPENILNGSMFSDLRTLYGDPSFEKALKDYVIGRLPRDENFVMRMAQNVLRFPPPFTLFGNIKVEKKGEHRGLLDVKKAGIFPITEGVKALALGAGSLNGGTRERMQFLTERGVLGREAAEDLETSYNFLVFVRLRGQVGAVQEGRTPTNHIALERLNRMEQGRLRLALEGVRTFQGFLHRHFRLDQVR